MEKFEPATDEGQITFARLDQNTAIESGDLARVATYWTEDVVLVSSLRPLIIGPKDYQAIFKIQPDGSTPLLYRRDTSKVEVSKHWPLAHEEGTWVAIDKNSSAQPAVWGRYSAQWVKRNGRWKIKGEVFVALTCTGVGCHFEVPGA